jgi:flotillin
MENEAAGIKAKGEAEAAAIQAKALAEAEGILKKAEAMKEYGEAAMADMQLEVSKALIDRMPEIMAAAGQAYTNVDSIYMYGGESSKLTEDIMKNVTQISEGVSQTLGIDLKQIANAYVGSVMANKSDK